MEYDSIIGLEIHVQPNTKSKMFCRCPNLNADTDKKPNTAVCPICLGHPGTLPVANREAIEQTALLGLALDAKINTHSKFDRKHYFYPDLPKAYQISQYDLPLVYSGHLAVDGTDIAITRIHLEEDAGKLLHPTNANHSLADYNRAGAPLLELVTEPVITSAALAKQFCQLYQRTLRYLQVSEADMEKGQMRCEANVSVQKKGSWKYEGDCKITPVGDAVLNPKVELKNINSFKAVEKAIEYEIKRHIAAIEAGETLVQETRGWNEDRGISVSQRTKEEAQEYRYFPDPDIAPITIDSTWLAQIRAKLVELPQAKKERFREQYGFSNYDADVLTVNKDIANYVEQVISELRAWVDAAGKQWEAMHTTLAKLTGNWIGTELFKHLNATNTTITAVRITPENFGQFIALVHEGTISSSAAQEIFEAMFATGGDPVAIMRERGLEQVSDAGALEAIITTVTENNEKAVAEYKAGKENALQFLVGQVMKESKGAANPQVARDMLLSKIKGN